MLKKLYDRTRVYGYYMSNSDIPRPILGIVLDSLLAIIVFFSVLYIWIVYRTKSPSLSLVISFATTLLFGFAIYLRKRKIYKKNRKQKRRQLSREYMLSNLSKLTWREFEWQIIKILSAFEGLSDIEQRQGYLRANYYNLPIAIGYYNSPPGGAESYDRLWAFYKSLRSKGFNYFLYVSSGSYEENCNNILKENLEDSIYLLDSNDLLDLMEKAGMQPNSHILNHLVDQEINNKRKKHKSIKNEAPPMVKFKKYMMSSILFLIVSLVFPSYSLFYFILSLLFLILGLLSLVLSKDKNDVNKRSLER